MLKHDSLKDMFDDLMGEHLLLQVGLRVAKGLILALERD
jgi:hypothetical protein